MSSASTVGAPAAGVELDSRAAAKYLGVSMSGLYAYCNVGALAFRTVSPPNRKRRTFRFLVADLEALRRQQTCGRSDSAQPEQPASLVTTTLGTIARSYPVQVAQPASLRCPNCDEPHRPSNYRRIPATTRLEKFLAAQGIGEVSLLHKLVHSLSRVGAASDLFPDDKLLSIRKGTRQPTVLQAEAIRLAVADILEKPVSLVDLFDLTQIRAEAQR